MPDFEFRDFATAYRGLISNANYKGQDMRALLVLSISTPDKGTFFDGKFAKMREMPQNVAMLCDYL